MVSWRRGLVQPGNTSTGWMRRQPTKWTQLLETEWITFMKYKVRHVTVSCRSHVGAEGLLCVAKPSFLPPGSGSGRGQVVSMEGCECDACWAAYVWVCCVCCVLGAGAGAKRRRAKPVDPAGEVSCAGG